MKMFFKRNSRFLMRNFLFLVLFLFLAGNSMALKPEHKDGMVVLTVEHHDDGYRTYYKSVVNGAETWLNRYYDLIFNYIKSPGSYYDVIPTYGPYPVRVTAWRLTGLLYRVSDLNARGWQSQVRYDLYYAMVEDRYYGTYKQVGQFWDPIYDWKWRSVYMEGRLNNSHTGGNCFGTADYMSKGREWIYAYPVTSVRQSSYFPFIWLDGYTMPDTVHCLDKDLKSSKFHFSGTGDFYNLSNYINAFDIVRYGSIPNGDPDELVIINSQGRKVYLGRAVHAAAYLCTDRSGISYGFEKIGCCKGYRIKELNQFTGNTISYFYHDGRYKQVVTENWDENWAGISY